MVEIDGLVLDIPQPVVGETCLQAIAPVIEGRVVDHEDLALRPHHVACQFAVVAVAREHVGDPHARLYAREAQNVGWMIQ